MTRPCTDIQSMLYAYELGMLGDDERQEIELHLIECGACFARAEKFADTADLMRKSARVRNAVDDHVQAYVPVDAELRSGRPKRPMTWIRVSLAAAAILVILLLRPWQFEIKPTLEAVAAENRLAVMRFENLGEVEDASRLGSIVSELLITDLSESRYLQVVSSQRVHDIIKLLDHADQLVVDRETATEIAQKASARWLLTGSVIRFDDNLVLTAHLVDVISGVIGGSFEVEAVAGESVFTLVDRLVAEIRDGLALPDQALSEYDRPVAEVTTHSTEAYRAYLEGLELVERLYRSEARDAFRRALQFDSTFAMAYYHLAQLGERELVDKAVEFGSEATRKEQHYIRALQADLSGNTDELVAQLRSLIKSFPDEKEGFFRLGEYFYNEVQFDSAIHYLERAIEVDPLYRSAHNLLTYSHSKAGDLVEAIGAINRYISLAPGEANPFDTRGDIYAENGWLDEAANSYAQALQVRPDFVTSALQLARMRVFQTRYSEADSILMELAARDDVRTRFMARLYRVYILLHQGRFDEALARIDTVIAVTRHELGAAGQVGERSTPHNIKAMIYAEMGDLEAALAEIDTCIQINDRAQPDDSVTYRYLYAKYLAELGEFDRVARLHRRLEAHWESTGQAPCYPLWVRGTTELARGNAAAAVEYLEESTALASVSSDFTGSYPLAVAYLEAGRLSDAVTLLERLLSIYSAGRLFETIAGVKLHYHLGIAYEQSQWYDRAVEQYETFLDIWQAADPDLTTVRDARERLARLRSRS